MLHMLHEFIASNLFLALSFGVGTCNPYKCDKSDWSAESGEDDNCSRNGRDDGLANFDSGTGNPFSTSTQQNRKSRRDAGGLHRISMTHWSMSFSACSLTWLRRARDPSTRPGSAELSDLEDRSKPVDVTEQQDATEFVQDLLDRLRNKLVGTSWVSLSCHVGNPVVLIFLKTHYNSHITHIGQ